MMEYEYMHLCMEMYMQIMQYMQRLRKYLGEGGVPLLKCLSSCLEPLLPCHHLCGL